MLTQIILINFWVCGYFDKHKLMIIFLLKKNRCPIWFTVSDQIRRESRKIDHISSRLTMANCIPLVFLSVLCLSITAKTHVQSSLYRDYKTKHGKFKSNQNQSLLVTLTKSHFLEDALECSFHCIGDSKCLSYNIAKSPDSNGIYICEVLATDKYRAKDRLQANSSFHHFSPMVSSFFLRLHSDQFSFECNHSFSHVFCHGFMRWMLYLWWELLVKPSIQYEVWKSKIRLKNDWREYSSK